MGALNLGELRAAGVFVDRLLETIMSAAVGGVVEGAPFPATATPTPSCIATETPSFHRCCPHRRRYLSRAVSPRFARASSCRLSAVFRSCSDPTHCR